MRLGPYPNPSSEELNSPNATQGMKGRELLFKAVAAWYTRRFFQVKIRGVLL